MQYVFEKPLRVIVRSAIPGKEPMLTVDALNMSKRRMFFTSAKAEAELGYTARPYVEAIADAMTWFREGH